VTETTTLMETDPLVAEALANEVAPQQDHIELIASENIVSPAVLEALGHEMANKTLERRLQGQALQLTISHQL
jgi:glycine hydroxymethyltransferase